MKTRTSNKDLLISFLSQRTESIQHGQMPDAADTIAATNLMQILQAKEDKHPRIRILAISKALESHGLNSSADALRTARDSTFPTGARGAPKGLLRPLQIGQTRRYKVTSQGQLRINAAPFGAKAGQFVDVTLNEGGLSIVPSSTGVFDPAHASA